jgi:hypothetical protein
VTDKTSRIVQYLRNNRTCTYHDLMAHCGMGKSTAKNALMAALDDGAVQMIRPGRSTGVGGIPAVYALPPKRSQRGYVPNVRSVFEMAQAL